LIKIHPIFKIDVLVLMFFYISEERS